MATLSTHFDIAEGSYGKALEVTALDKDGNEADWSDATTITGIFLQPDGETVDTLTGSLKAGTVGTFIFTPTAATFFDVVGDGGRIDVRVQGSGYDEILEQQATFDVRAKIAVP